MWLHRSDISLLTLHDCPLNLISPSIFFILHSATSLSVITWLLIWTCRLLIRSVMLSIRSEIKLLICIKFLIGSALAPIYLDYCVSDCHFVVTFHSFRNAFQPFSGTLISPRFDFKCMCKLFIFCLK